MFQPPSKSEVEAVRLENQRKAKEALDEIRKKAEAFIMQSKKHEEQQSVTDSIDEDNKLIPQKKRRDSAVAAHRQLTKELGIADIDIEIGTLAGKRLTCLLVANSEDNAIVPMVQLSTELLLQGHKVYLLTTTYDLHRVQVLTADLCKLDNFKLAWSDEDQIEREDFHGFNLDNQFIMPGQETWIPAALQRASSLNVNFDVVVTDIFTVAGARIADNLKLPLVVNVPHMLGMYELMAHQRTINTFNSRIFCGSLHVFENVGWTGARSMVQRKQTPLMKVHLDALPQRLVICNSFWGLDMPSLIQPNLHLTGSLAQHDWPLMSKKLMANDPELHAFLDLRHQSQIRVVYINFGENIRVEKWLVDYVYDGIKEVFLKDLSVQFILVAHSNKIPDGHPCLLDGNIKILYYTPVDQAAMVMHPAICGGVISGDFGSSMDFINAGKPFVAYPHTNAQGTVTIAMNMRGVSTSLINPLVAMAGDRHGFNKQSFIYKEPNFTPAKFCEAVIKVLDDEKLCQKAQVMRRHSNAQGGANRAINVLQEAVARFDQVNKSNEMPEVVDLELVRRQRSINGGVRCCCNCIIFIIVGLLIWLVVEFFRRPTIVVPAKL